MRYHFANRISVIKPSATVAINSLAMELKAAGRKIINLSVGEPDFDTPDFIKDAAIQAIQQGFTKYTAPEGILELREAIARKLKHDNDLEYAPNQIMVSAGGKQSFHNLTQVILNSGDEVIIPAPYWVSYPELVKLAEATPIIIKAEIEQDFKITPEQLEKAITPRTRLFVLNSPSNPSGKAYTPEELRKLADVLVKHPQVLIATDDMYEYILWSQPKFFNILNVAPELKNQTVILNGASKAYAMTGWRIGYAAGPNEIIQNMKKVQSQTTTTSNSIAQKATVAALNAKRSQLQYMFDAYHQRHEFFYNELKKIPGFECIPADGTFYLFPRVSKIIQKMRLDSDIELAKLFLDKADIAAVPGAEFGMPGYIRFSYATSEENLKQAVKNLKEILQ